MKSEQSIEGHVDRERDRLEAFVRKPDDATTPQEKLVRAAESGRFETIVAAAQPAEPTKMVSPEEREAELRATGQWPAEQKPEPAAPPDAAAEPEPTAPEPGMPTEPTPGMAWAEEHMRRRPHGSGNRRPAHNPYRCLTEYDPLTGKIIGDGYDHRFDGDDE
jgi:hypothetical protein